MMMIMMILFAFNTPLKPFQTKVVRLLLKLPLLTNLFYFQAGLTAGLMGGLKAGLRACLKAGLKAGLKACLKAGLTAGLKACLKAGLEAGLKACLRTGLKAGLHLGLPHNRFFESSFSAT